MVFVYNKKVYADTTLSMGSHSNACCCQRVTSAVVHIFGKFGHFAINYLDDLGGVETSERAEEAFKRLRKLIQDFGLKEALDKSVAPCMVMVFLGILIDTVKLTLSIPSEKMLEIRQLLQEWNEKTTASLKEVQQLAGLLNFACRCVRSGRVYLSRILNFLRELSPRGRMTIPKSVRLDIQWWEQLAPHFNGTSFMLENDWMEPDVLVSTDSCLTGGGTFNFTTGGFSHWEYPNQIKELNCDINQLECLMVVVSLKLWRHTLLRKHLVVQCDNQVTVEALNSASSRNVLMQRCLRELHKLMALYSFDFKAIYLPGVQNRISDFLSRFHIGERYRDLFYKEMSDRPEIYE